MVTRSRVRPEGTSSRRSLGGRCAALGGRLKPFRYGLEGGLWRDCQRAVVGLAQKGGPTPDPFASMWSSAIGGRGALRMTKGGVVAVSRTGLVTLGAAGATSVLGIRSGYAVSEVCGWKAEAVPLRAGWFGWAEAFLVARTFLFCAREVSRLHAGGMWGGLTVEREIPSLRCEGPRSGVVLLRMTSRRAIARRLW